MSALLNADQPIIPVVELQSGPLMPGLVLDESPRPIHQIRLVVDASYRRGMLILDGSRPEFDEFGGLVGGIQTPEVRGTEESSLISQISCHIELVKDRSGTWRLYRVKSPELRTPLRIATRGSIDSGGPARIIVLGPDDSVKAVVECTRYGMVIP
jgi:hypothetical protein